MISDVTKLQRSIRVISELAQIIVCSLESKLSHLLAQTISSYSIQFITIAVNRMTKERIK